MRRSVFVMPCLIAAFVAGGCIGSGDPGGSARDGGVVVIGASAVPATLDPALATDARALQALWPVYTPLLSYRHAEGREGTDLIPGLARQLPHVSEDGLSYVFTLRRGLRYGNGKAVRPGDFERAVDRVRALDSPLARLYRGIASIDAEARSRQIRVNLSAPDPAFEHVLALPSSAPVPAGVPARDLSEQPPPGVGPYRILAVHAGRRLVLARRSDFDLPGIAAGHVDRIVVTRVASPARQVQGVQTGALDLMQEPAPSEVLPELRSKYRDRYREDAAATTIALISETTSPPLDDPSVRRAISEALDGEELDRLYGGFLETTCNVLPEAVLGYRRLDPCPYGDRSQLPNLVAAEQEVKDAGATAAAVGVRSAPAVPPPVARYVVRTLRKIGLHARLGGRYGARLAIERIAPAVAHPAAFLEPLARSIFDEELTGEVTDALDAPATEGSADAWAAIDERLVTEAYAAPLGSERRPSFFSDRIDTANCVREHPVFGTDFSALCLR
jgi:peptide/nickel transport system substrate-binding protein